MGSFVSVGIKPLLGPATTAASEPEQQLDAPGGRPTGRYIWSWKQRVLLSVVPHHFPGCTQPGMLCAHGPGVGARSLLAGPACVRCPGRRSRRRSTADAGGDTLAQRD